MLVEEDHRRHSVSLDGCHGMGELVGMEFVLGLAQLMDETTDIGALMRLRSRSMLMKSSNSNSSSRLMVGPSGD